MSISTSIPINKFSDCLTWEPIRKSLEEKKNNHAANLKWELKIEDTQKISNRSPLIVALGVIAMLGGLFLALTAHNILPVGINCIGGNGYWLAGGYGILGLGLIILAIGTVKTHKIQKINSKVAHYENEMSKYGNETKDGLFISNITFLKDHLETYLQEDEMLAVQYEGSNELMVFERNPSQNSHHKIIYSYYEKNITAEKINRADKKSFIELSILQARYAEKMKKS